MDSVAQPIAPIVIEFFKEVPDYLAFLANCVVVLGALPVFFWLKNRAFERKKQEMSDNLRVRRDIKAKLLGHVNGYDRSTPHDIGIRLVHWKNYPWKLDNDGYQQLLYYDTNLDERLSHGTEFLTNTGILVEEPIWAFDRSLYLGRYGTYIISEPGRELVGFNEVRQKLKLIRTLRYKHIINWDFEEKIEYEPVFYTRYKYTNRKLFEDEFFAQNRDRGGEDEDLYFREILDRRNRVKSSKSLKYRYLILGGTLTQWRKRIF